MEQRGPRTLVRALTWAWLGCWCCCALVATGCANFRLPRIDPSGERLFLPCNAPPPPPPMVPGAPPPPLAPPGVGQSGISVSPSQVIAPVGSEVVMIASVCGGDEFMTTRQRVEWNLAPDGAGQLLSPGQREPFGVVEWMHGLPKKVDSRYAVNTTLMAPMTLDRGTPTPTDDILVQPGQSWISVTSPTEGVSHVTAFAPDVVGWDRRQQTATIYWVDSQWRFPPPAISAVGSRHSLVTQITRQSDGSPLAGWTVRYEISGGPDAGFAPDGANAVEVVSNSLGEATAEIFQKQSTAGTNQISIQVIRPAGIGGQSRALPIGSGSTLQTWTSSELSIRATGPSQVAVGSTISYRLEIANPAATAVRDIVVADQTPPGLEFVDSTPAPASAGGENVRQWNVGEVAAHGAAAIEARYRVAQPGNYNFCVTVSSDNGTTARSCVTTSAIPGGVGGGAVGGTITPPVASDRQLEVTIEGPTEAVVGSDPQFEIRVANRGNTPLTGILVNDRFDAGLKHDQAGQAIEHDMIDLQPGGEETLNVTLRVVQPGQWCQNVTVTAAGGNRATAKHCLTATAEAGTESPSAAQPPAQSPSDDRVPHTVSAGALSMVTSMATVKRVGDKAMLDIELTNTSDQAVNDLEIATTFETSVEPAQATEGHEWRGSNTLYWKVPSLGPGKSLKRNIEFRCLRDAPRSCVRVMTSAPGAEALNDQACMRIGSAAAPAEAQPTRPQAAAAPLTVKVAETSDPVKVGEKTTYQVLISNPGQQSVFDVVLHVTFSGELQFEGSEGPPVQGAVTAGTIRYNPIREIRAGENPLNFEFHMKALKAGNARFHVDVTSRGQPTPLTEEQTTEILP